MAPDIVGDLTLSQAHCISVIGDIENAYVTKISNELDMTTGAITKICKKLFKQGLIDKEVISIGVDMAGAQNPATHLYIDQYCADR